MKKTILIAFLIISKTILFAQETPKIKATVWDSGVHAKTIYKIDGLEEKLANHKTIAILPFKVSILYNNPPKNLDPQTTKDEEKRMSFDLQSSMFSYLSNSKDYYKVQIQNEDTTDILLNEHNMMNNPENYTPEEIAKVLGVDAVVYCTYTYTKVGSNLEAIGVQLLVGLHHSKVATGELTMDIYNGADGELLWAFNKIMNQEALTSPESIVRRMMSKVERNFPYKK